MKQDRFLTGILIGIGALILLALVLFFTRKDTKAYQASDAPTAVVYNYVLAITNEDYEKAYTYLADKENKPTYDEFRQSFFNGSIHTENVGVDVGEAEIDGDDANVDLTMVYSSTDPFSGGYSNTDRAQLVRQSDEWKIIYMPYNFWAYDWYQEPIK
ncbi:MAG: hypothetical protein H7Y59_18795 [Anaerolineales bacterium]|nr:hypothetical protein [Anaerolineales bacterium]